MTDVNGTEAARDRLLAAALPHVAFDGWSEKTLTAAIAESGVPPGLARALFPRGGVDLALEWHRRGDRRMAEALAGADMTGFKFRDKVTKAVRLRLEFSGPRDLVRRSSGLFGLRNPAGVQLEGRHRGGRPDRRQLRRSIAVPAGRPRRG